MRVGIQTIGLFVLFLLAGQPAYAQAANDPSGGFGAWLIAVLFEAGSIAAPPDNPGLIGSVIRPIGIIMMVAASVVIVAKSIQHLLIVAQARDPSQSPISMTWAPIHMVIAIVLILPTASGYSAGQHGAIWVGKQSNMLANLATREVTNFFVTQGSITPIPAPEMRPAIEAAIRSGICREIFNSSGPFLESMGVSQPTQIQTVNLGTGADNPFAVRPLDRNTTVTTVYRINPSEDRYVTPRKANEPACGGISVSFTNSFEVDNPPPKEIKNPQTFLQNVSAGDSVTLEDGSVITKSLYRFGSGAEIEALIERASSVHDQAARSAVNFATSHRGIQSVARNLLFDLKAHLNLIANPDAADAEALEEILKQEAAYIDRAADQTVQLYKDATRDIRGMYARVLQEQRRQQDRDWVSAINETGWPALGLYWLQFSATNDRIQDALSVSVTPIEPAIQAPQMVLGFSGSDALAERLDARLSEYWRRVQQKLSNDPITAPVANYQDISLGEAKMRFDASMDRIDLKLTRVISNSNGEYSADDTVVSQFFNGVVRDNVYPLFMKTLKTDDNILIALTNVGHLITVGAGSAYFAGKTMEAQEEIDTKTDREGLAEKGLDAIQSAITGFLTGGASLVHDVSSAGVRRVVDKIMANPFLRVLWEIAQDALHLAGLLIIPGLFLAFYLPSVIMIQWLTQVVTWLIYLVEAVIVIPIWGVLFVTDMGQSTMAPQSARQGLVHFLSILLYPSLMVVGFVTALKIVDIISGFFVAFLEQGFLDATDGYGFGIVSIVAGIAIVGFVSYQILMRIFSQMMELNTRIISWVGQMPSFGDSQLEHGARGGIIAFLQRGEGRTRSRPSRNPDPS